MNTKNEEREVLRALEYKLARHRVGPHAANVRSADDVALAAEIYSDLCRTVQGEPSEAAVRAGALAMYKLAPELSMSGASDLARAALRAAAAIGGSDDGAS